MKHANGTPHQFDLESTCTICGYGAESLLAESAAECAQYRAALLDVRAALVDCRAVFRREGYKTDSLGLDIARALTAADAALGPAGGES